MSVSAHYDDRRCSVPGDVCAGGVDDHAEIRKILKIGLKKAGFETQEACDGEEAIEKAKSPIIVIGAGANRKMAGRIVPPQTLPASPDTRGSELQPGI